MFVILVYTENGTSVYGDWYGQPFKVREDAMQEVNTYKKIIGVKRVVVQNIQDSINRVNDGS